VGAVALRGRGNVTALCALFDEIWADATPWGDRGVAQRREPGLTGQEIQAIRLLGEGMTDEAIAKRLGVSTRTVRRLVSNVMTVLDARSRFEAGVRAVQEGWIDAGR
jgi:DNA-binding NarL/FixJ family response regulator